MHAISQPTQNKIQQSYFNLSKTGRKPVLLSQWKCLVTPVIPTSELLNFPKLLLELFDEDAATASSRCVVKVWWSAQ